MFKKSVVMGLTFALAATAFVGCGSKDDTNKSTGDNTAKPAEKAPEKLVVGFIPSQNAETLQAKAKPMGELLSKELGIPVEVTVTTNFNALVEGMAAKKVDVGFLNPINYVFAHDKKKAADLLLQTSRQGSASYKSVFVKKKGDATIKDVKDIKGKKVAFVDGASAAGYLYPVVMIKNAGLNPDTDISGVMSGGHDKALMALYRGDVDVATVFDAAIDQTIAKTTPDAKDKLEIFATSEPIPNDTVSIRPDLPADFKTKVADAFKKIMSTDEGKKIGMDIYNFDGLVAGDDKNFDPVRKMIEATGAAPK
ncbi:phosphate/phosphite/phosphonate ABC transporter substrate-binding protein [Tumebacillus sp. ITR2]|uniref:Phosphate/phosphite/phosphonate ABC transporter substrate-binding protein n=1 Tax=Tumebacillus amylolyticus TaxID=2801339 RepID=A0ABS1J9S1_9BACL|nr:phosphate/phosphite/phosphonate ABC transporter substrate-binding protein [Tumebacillus amylolyticus]MBL0387021.1 phosphate/phosphite/phosphonate ABC transporter substrate-binding protein [Tumebacillus amylolyticus]